MFSLKQIALSLIAILSTQISWAVNNPELLIVNNLKKPLSYKVLKSDGDFKCSQEFGITRSNHFSKLSYAQIDKACSDDCVAYVYPSENCTGKEIAYLDIQLYRVTNVVTREVEEGVVDIQRGDNFVIFYGFNKRV